MFTFVWGLEGRTARGLLVFVWGTVSYSLGYLQTHFVVEVDLELLVLLCLTPE